MLKKFIFIGVLGYSQTLLANMYHLKLLSDTTPDLSSMEAFSYDIGHNWTENNEKAIVLGYWLGKLTKYGAPLYFSRQWDDPIAFLNNNSYGMCSDMTLLMNAMGEGAFGFKGRHHELNRLDNPLTHTVPELEYDNALHFIDPSYGLAYCHYDNGTIASLEDAALNPYLTRHNLPSALTRDSDGNGAIKAWLSYGRKDRTTDKLRHGEYSPSQTWIEKRTEGYYGVHTFDINLKEDEFYTRYWDHLDGLEGFNAHDFFWPHYNFKSRNNFSWNENAGGEHRSNGLWVYEPHLGDERAYESSSHTQTVANHIYPRRLNEEAEVTFKVDAANFITGTLIEADISRETEADSVIIEASSNGGSHWFTIWKDQSVGEHIVIRENISDMLRGTLRSQDLRPVTDYLLRVKLESKSDIRASGLNAIKLSTVTVLNKNALPKLELGSNEISIGTTHSTQYQISKLNPVMTKLDHGENGSIQWQDQEVWKLYAKDHENVTAVQNRNNLYTGLWKTSSRLGWVTYEMNAPRAIKKASIGGSFIVRENSSDKFKILYRTFNGVWSDWVSLAEYDWSSRNNDDARENQTHLESWNITQADVRKIEFKTEMRGYPHIEALHMEIEYEPKQTLDKPLDITYSWTEYHEDAQGDLPANADTGTTRTYRERITALPHTFFVNTGGDIQPRMNWVSMNLAGYKDSRNNAPLGYSDGVDSGNNDFIPMVTYDIGEIVSIGKTVTASTQPNAGSLSKLLDGKITSPSDGQHSNVNEIVQFNQGVGSVDFIIDLGSVQTVGGVRVDSYLANKRSSLFPEKISVEALVDGIYQMVGRDLYHSAKYSNNLWSASWSTPEHAHSKGEGNFPNYGLYSNYTFVPFDHAINARYIKVTVDEQDLRGSSVGFSLSEIHVYDKLIRQEWSPKLAHASGEMPVQEPVSMYEDAEDEDIQGWTIFSNSSNTASIHNIFDQSRGSRVISLEGVGRGDGYMLGARRGEGAWNDTLNKKIQWSMKYAETFTIYISLETSKGRRYLTYSQRDEDRGLHGSYIAIGLGSARANGTWQTIRRDLLADLKRYEADNEIISVNAFLIRGSGRIDNLSLLR